MHTTYLFLLLTAAVIVYFCRWSGFILKFRRSSAALEHFLHFVPITVFSSLVVLSLAAEVELVVTKMLALTAAGATYWRTQQFGLSLVVGFILFWLLITL